MDPAEFEARMDAMRDQVAAQQRQSGPGGGARYPGPPDGADVPLPGPSPVAITVNDPVILPGVGAIMLVQVFSVTGMQCYWLTPDLAVGVGQLLVRQGERLAGAPPEVVDDAPAAAAPLLGPNGAPVERVDVASIVRDEVEKIVAEDEESSGGA